MDADYTSDPATGSVSVPGTGVAVAIAIAPAALAPRLSPLDPLDLSPLDLLAPRP
jgi:hypothetical protein